MPRQPRGVLVVPIALLFVGSGCGGKGSGIIGTPTGGDAGGSDASGGVITSIVDAGVDSTVLNSVDASLDATVPNPLDAGVDADAGSNEVTDAGDADVENDTGAPPHECIPGQSIGCVGPGGCVTNQVCNAAGSGYGPCTCVGDASALACVPGQSIVCGGPGGCTSFQVCESDGSGYGPCDCPDAGVDASSAWSPAQLPGLALWLDDTYGIVMDPSHAGSVLHWLDRSGNGNEVTTIGTYGSTGVVPPWEGFPLDPEGVNGFDGVQCPSSPAPLSQNSTFMSIDSSTTLDWANGDFAIVMVVKPLESAWSDLWTGNGITLDANYDGKNATSGAFALEAPGGFVTVAPALTSKFNVVFARGQTLDLRVAGIEATGATNATPLTAGTVLLCENHAVEYAEVIAVKGPLSDANVANLSAYFHAKFGL